MNSDYTGTGTQDWILASMLHGFINYHDSRTQAGFITQDEFDRMFPLFANDPQVIKQRDFNMLT